MPATFAHPAFAWPLRRSGLPLAALVIGSMVPDVAHLLPRRPWTDHTALSVLSFSLPLGLLVHLVFARWMAEPLAELAPRPWRAAFAATARGLAGARIDLRVVAAIALGAAIHVAIDACTHVTGTVVTALPGLFGAELASTAWGPLPVYKALQYGGGLAGTGFLGARGWAWAARARSHSVRPYDLLPVTGFLGLIAVLAGVYGWSESYWLPAPTRYHVFLVQGAVGALVLLAGSALALASGLRLVRQWRRWAARVQGWTRPLEPVTTPSDD